MPSSEEPAEDSSGNETIVDLKHAIKLKAKSSVQISSEHGFNHLHIFPDTSKRTSLELLELQKKHEKEEEEIELVKAKLSAEHVPFQASTSEDDVSLKRSSGTKRFRFNIFAFFRSRYQENLRRRNMQRRREALRSDLSDISEEEQVGSSLYIPRREDTRCFPFFCWKMSGSNHSHA